MEGRKLDTGKAPMALLSHTALMKISQVMEFGAKKYSADNWRFGMAWRRILSAAMRHIGAFSDGEDKDPETQLSHIAHAACCLMFLLEYEETHRDKDDRFLTHQRPFTVQEEEAICKVLDEVLGNDGT